MSAESWTRTPKRAARSSTANIYNRDAPGRFGGEVGAGRFDYAAAFDFLKMRGYTGWIRVEQNGPMGDKTPLTCARASRAFIRQGMGV